MKSGSDKMQRIIRRQEPVRPSTKLGQTLAASAWMRIGGAETAPPILILKSNEEVTANSRRLLQLNETIAALQSDLVHFADQKAGSFARVSLET